MVERPCPVPKGLRPLVMASLTIRTFVERPCPVPKGLRHRSTHKMFDFPRRKTLPCSKGIETQIP